MRTPLQLAALLTETLAELSYSIQLFCGNEGWGIGTGCEV